MCDSWPGERVEHDRAVLDPRTAHAGASHAPQRASRVRPRRPGRNAGLGSASPWSASSAGRTNSSKPTRDETGLPGKPEDERAAADAERDRLAGTNRDAPEDLLDAELGLGGADEVVGRRPRRRRSSRARRPRGRARSRRAGRSASSRHRWQPVDRRAGAADLGGEDHAVRVVDLAALERLARRAQLGPGDGEDDPRPPGCTPRASHRRPRARPGARGRAACLRPRRGRRRRGRRRAASRSRPSRPLPGTTTTPSRSSTSSIGTTESAPSGTTPPVAIAIAWPASSAAADRPPGGDPRDDRKRRRRVGGAEREPVHRGGGNDGRSTDGRGGRGQHAAGGLVERHILGLERPRVLEHELERLGDRQQLVGHGTIRAPATRGRRGVWPAAADCPRAGLPSAGIVAGDGFASWWWSWCVVVVAGVVGTAR